ncbi:MAG: hypothetical protein ABIQ74_07565, partial [Chitinophagales bacterium]
MKINFLISCCLIVTIFANAQVTTIHHPEIIALTLEKISPPLKSIPDRPAPEGGIRTEHDNFSLEHPIPITKSNPLPHGADPAIQKSYGQRTPSVNKMDTAGSALTILQSLEGLSENVDPSDNTIAVGIDHVVQLVNTNGNSTAMRVWDKSGAVLASSIALEDLTGLKDYGDPSIIYDEQADRYALLVLAFSGSKLIVAVSQTGDAMGSYYSYSFSTAGGYPDYPKLAAWGNSYFITTNSNSPSIFALNRDSLIAGAPFSFVQKFSLSSFQALGFQTASPVHFTGSIAPANGSPELIMRIADDAWGGNVDSDHLEIFKTKINWVDTSLSEISGPYNLKTADYNSDLCGFNSFSCIPQKGNNSKLDPLSNILMDKTKYRAFIDHESIVGTHVVNTGDGKAGIRWYELRSQTNGDWYIYQQGTFAPPDTNNRWISSISINDDGAIALCYNISSKETYTGMRITGRLECDSLGLMTIGEIVAQEGSAANGSTRYGDYNGLVTDPVDGSFWLTGQYNPSSAWSTNVTHFTLETCTATITPPVNISNEEFKVTPNPATDNIVVSVFST